MRYHSCCWAILAACAVSASTYGQPIMYSGAPNNYHAQIYNNWCGTASIEMMMDCPAVTNNNATLLNNLLNAGDGPTIPAGGPRPVATTNAGVVTGETINGVPNPGGAQAFIYGLTHNANTVNGVTYNNPYVPYGVGTDSGGVVFATNALDNPNFNGNAPFSGPAFGSHVYSGYNAAPTSLGGAAATRTIVNCIADYQVPAQIVVGGGAHSMIANGAITSGQPGAPGGPANGTGTYTLYYVQVSDPWTGYAISQPASNNGTMGWGENTLLRYGYDVVNTGGIQWQLPNGTTVNNARPGLWWYCFNVSSPQASAGYAPTPYNFTSYGYKFTVEPQGPESLDTGDPSIDGSLPPPPPLLNTPITSDTGPNGALMYAGSDLALPLDSAIAADMNMMGSGSLDPNPSDAMLLQLGGTAISQGDGDWLVPYDGSGGTNDVQGALLIDQDTGVIDEATWLTPQDNLPGYTLSQLDSMMEAEAAGNEPNDNPVPLPEPGTVGLLISGGVLAVGRWAVRRRRARH